MALWRLGMLGYIKQGSWDNMDSIRLFRDFLRPALAV